MKYEYFYEAWNKGFGWGLLTGITLTVIGISILSL